MEQSKQKPIRVLVVDPDCPKCEGTGIDVSEFPQMCVACIKPIEIEAVTMVLKYSEPGQTVPLEDLMVEKPIPIREKVEGEPDGI